MSFRVCALLAVLLLIAPPFLAPPGLAADRTEPSREKPALVTRADAVRAVPRAERDSVKGWYIVELDPAAGDAGELADELATGRGALVSHVYRAAISGFAAKLTPKQAKALARDPRVRAVTPDERVELPPVQPVEPLGPRQNFPPNGQTTPFGIQRIQAPNNPLFPPVGSNVDADVAVIDSGIDGGHPDLNYAGGISCVGDENPADQDDAGHGTHVAGTIGALNNDEGVVGVAPGVRLYSARVFAGSGGTTRAVLCGLDWVTENAGIIDAANMSLGGAAGRSVAKLTCERPRKDDFLKAVCRAVDAGVTVVVAAGNECTNANRVAPAGYAPVIAVGAFADSDGQPGNYGPNVYGTACNRAGSQALTPDDTMSPHSNYGSVVDIWAPGVRVLSTVPEDFGESNRPYAVFSGTSMASPHVAGAAALVIAANPEFTPAQVKAALLDQAERRTIRNTFSGTRWNGKRPGSVDAAIVNVNNGPPWPSQP